MSVSGTPRTLMAEGLAELGLGERSGLAERLLRYVAEIEAWNPSLGLVKASGGELVVRHVLDSLAGVPVFARLAPGSVVVDVGSGAGLPGIPLAMALPEMRFVLLERSSRRCTFLDHCVAVLDIGNATVFGGEARSYAGPADVVTFRAVSPLTPEFLRTTGILALAPLLVAYKGTLERTRAEIESIRALCASVEEVVVHVPFLEGERTLALLRP